MTTKKILVLAANPTDTTRLRLDEEFDAIRRAHRGAKLRDQFELELLPFARQRNIRHEILDHEPYLVHFSGHGTKESRIVIAKDDGSPHLVTLDALDPFFKIFSHHVRCVLLNSCYSSPLAERLSEHIAYSIGMKGGLDNNPAILYAEAFYDALFSGMRIENAHEVGRNSILFSGEKGHGFPELWVAQNIQADARETTLISTGVSDPVEPLSAFERKQQARKLDAARERWERLFERHSALQKAHDLETRVEEKMRLEPLIAESGAALEGVEEELRGLVPSRREAKR